MGTSKGMATYEAVANRPLLPGFVGYTQKAIAPTGRCTAPTDGICTFAKICYDAFAIQGQAWLQGFSAQRRYESTGMAAHKCIRLRRETPWDAVFVRTRYLGTRAVRNAKNTKKRRPPVRSDLRGAPAGE